MNFRDGGDAKRNGKKNKKDDDDEMDSDNDEDDDSILGKADDEEAKADDAPLSVDEIRRQSELSEGVRKIKVSSVHIYNGEVDPDICNSLNASILTRICPPRRRRKSKRRIQGLLFQRHPRPRLYPYPPMGRQTRRKMPPNRLLIQPVRHSLEVL